MTNDELLAQVADMLERQTQRIELKLELEVSKKIDALFDGYTLTHEKQCELERRVEELESKVS